MEQFGGKRYGRKGEGKACKWVAIPSVASGLQSFPFLTKSVRKGSHARLSLDARTGTRSRAIGAIVRVTYAYARATPRRRARDPAQAHTRARI